MALHLHRGAQHARLLDGAIGEAGVLSTAVEMEGHPDNVVASLRGGAQVSIRNPDGKVVSCSIALKRPLRAALYIPDQELATTAARSVLPREVSLEDAVFNVGRSSLLVAALVQGEYELLKEAMQDRLHQPARAGLLPWLPALLEAAVKAGALSAALSGAGQLYLHLHHRLERRRILRMHEDAARADVGRVLEHELLHGREAHGKVRGVAGKGALRIVARTHRDGADGLRIGGPLAPRQH